MVRDGWPDLGSTALLWRVVVALCCWQRADGRSPILRTSVFYLSSALVPLRRAPNTHARCPGRSSTVFRSSFSSPPLHRATEDKGILPPTLSCSETSGPIPGCPYRSPLAGRESLRRVDLTGTGYEARARRQTRDPFNSRDSSFHRIPLAHSIDAQSHRHESVSPVCSTQVRLGIGT